MIDVEMHLLANCSDTRISCAKASLTHHYKTPMLTTLRTEGKFQVSM
jgi:hypothetical protein